MIMYVIFNVGWMKINYISVLNIILQLITIAIYAEDQDLSSVETIMLVIYSFVVTIGITMI
jgi:hypothetical protein